jgi:hypothetical protein
MQKVRLDQERKNAFTAVLPDKTNRAGLPP